jgi:hypothetical protein
MTWKPDYNVTPQRIVCAANQHKDGAIIVGIRHFDEVMRATIDLRKQINPDEDWHGCDQGFIDQFNNFISREDAWLIACKANQIYRFCGGQTKEDFGKTGIKLYSENLY